MAYSLDKNKKNGADYMANFSPGAKFEIAREKRKTLSLSMPKLSFHPGLKFECDNMRFSWISARSETFFM